MEEWLKTVSKSIVAGCMLTQSTFAGPVQAELKFQETLAFDSSSGGEALQSSDYQLTQSSLRLKSEHAQGSWVLDTQLLFAANYSRRWQALSSGLPPSPAKPLVDLDTTVSSGKEGELNMLLDRASLNYTTDLYALKMGRQALTWGNGKVFNPMDRFDPFPPQAQDTSYKPGADMFYLQRLFDSGADLQIIYLPRRSISTNQVSQEVSSLAAKLLFYKGSWQLEFMASEDWGDEVLGVSAVGAMGAALWSTDLVYTNLLEGGNSTSLTTNLQHAWTWREKPSTGFLEYAHNGLGVSDLSNATMIPPMLSTRIARGQVFNTGRDYLALGLSTQWNPLTTLTPSVILNLQDQSGIAQLSALLNASDNDNLIFGVQAPFGSGDSEYGNPANPLQIYLRWERFF